MALAGVVVLPVGYFGSFLLIQIADGAGVMPAVSPSSPLALLYRPLGWYIDDSGLPGAKLIEEMTYAAYDFGRSRR
jgi:hypothetical protein